MGTLHNGCPGAASIRGTPTIEERICPECGEIIELFSVDVQVTCSCGFVAYNDIQNCVGWCKHARNCVGDEAYERVMRMNHAENGKG